MIDDKVEYFMQEAILEGRRAIEKCETNPPVGCVIVASDKILARGHTNEPGKPHAEAMALSQLKGNVKNLKAFVTLEPCSYKGRTPSCAKALIVSGISEVYVGIIDPHPQNNGAGVSMLKDAGIKVSVGILANKIHDELEAFLYKGT
jgi:pyrimidine deaminase RibD-like protein